ncbi:hypothetical protein RM780_05620 [Streptomyces sp. DSM 44917]|uniref:Transcriptional regulator, AbiEi antitoxin, Type IV TA system n=1 Tax=Streptomyces boetiae TaxID=3075541 RepID=A0ABU2L4F7_9ACTN|nr:hypothetical protein [Streptomyces sp. DSM 44917]MDT0306440.1 hypothetical protein [Streptomyces sp. DSM 44917]
MSDEMPIAPRPLRQLADGARMVMTGQELREHGVPPAAAHERCRPGGPWQMPLPGVFLLRPGPPTAAETLQAVLRYTGGREGEAVVSGLAALGLHGVAGVPPVTALEGVDVLVPRIRRLRSVGWARITRTPRMPRPVTVDGFPVAPVPRALADAVAALAAVPPQQARGERPTVRRLLTEAVRGGHCEPQAVLRELARAGTLGLPQVAGAVDTLLVEGRTAAEARLQEVVREERLPDPCWNVGLWLPDGPFLASVDAYWPHEAVAVEIDARVPRRRPGRAEPARPGRAREAEPEEEADRRRLLTLAGLGITLLRVTPRQLRHWPHAQAQAVRAALEAAAHRPPATYVVVLPR